MKLVGAVAGAAVREQRARVADLQRQREEARQSAVILALLPYAAPRLPAHLLMCFDQLQRQIRPLPGQGAGRRRRVAGRVPAPRGPRPEEVASRVRLR